MKLLKNFNNNLEVKMFWEHRCTNSRVYDYDFDLLPVEVKTILVEKRLKDGKLKYCKYCSAIWIETKNYNYSPPQIIITLLGIEDLVTKKIVWKVLESQK